MHAVALAAEDAALCSLGLMYVPESGCALEEMHRAVKPGGSL